jgi:hypothetical protein|tara:strand:- start:24 stop:593 length:570 start_codon:yes stop_codon:yes gene_type:complete
MDFEKLRKKPIDELTNKEKEALAGFLYTQVPVDEITNEEKKFLSAPLQTKCRECARAYSIEPAVNIYGLCHICMAEKGFKYEKNPFTPVSNFFWTFIKIAAPAAIIIYIFISIFDDTPSSSSYTSPSSPSSSSYSSSSSSSSSSNTQACISKSEKQFESCLYSIPGTASEADMNYCLDLHEARTYSCKH